MNLRKCLLTRNECYIRGGKLKPRGVMVHSTGANNPNLRRYVQPDDGNLGVNQNRNHWNAYRPGCNAYPDGGSATRCAKCPLAAKERRCAQKCVHAFIGRLADGTVATYQTLPWDMRGWHAGGDANDTHIGFEICEDDLYHEDYFKAVYREAVELTAHLCKLYDLDPLADGVVICHAEGHRRGIASQHGDVEHWFPRFGKTMDQFRQDVAAKMKEDEDEMQYFGTIKDVPEWYRPSVQKIIDAGVLKGTDPTGEVINISEDNCRLLTWLDRLGKLD